MQIDWSQRDAKRTRNGIFEGISRFSGENDAAISGHGVKPHTVFFPD
jgi:hypothetical protein